MAAGLYGGVAITSASLTLAGARHILVRTVREFAIVAQRPEDPRGKAMSMAASDIERLIRARIPDAEVTVGDLCGGRRPLRGHRHPPYHSAASPVSNSIRSSMKRSRRKWAASCTPWRCRPAHPIGEPGCLAPLRWQTGRELAGGLCLPFRLHISPRTRTGFGEDRRRAASRKDDRNGYRAVHRQRGQGQ